MIIPFIKKDLLVLYRNPQELMVLLLMPLVLIAILGFALGGVMGNEPTTISAKVAFIDNSDEKKDTDAFIEKVKAKNLPMEAEEAFSQGAEQLKPIQILVNKVFGSKDLKEIVQLEVIEPEQIEGVRNDESFAAIIEIPEKYTLDILSSVLLEEPTSTSIKVYKNEEKEISSNVVEDILLNYQKQLSTMTVIGKAGIQLAATDNQQLGSVETVSKQDPINSVQYYTVGMSVMFIMFIASNISSFAYREKQIQVFNRIILSNTSRWSYLTGIFTSVMIIAFIQQMILYGVTSLVFDVMWKDILGFLLVNLSLCFAIGGLATLLTALNYRINSEAVSNFFGNVMVAIFSFLGGSFTPIGDSSSVIGFLGNFTPNGAGMTSLLQLLQGEELSSISNHILYLLVFGLIMLTAAVVSFPKRGDAI
ncbi:ABC transporter permease [Bacillus solitudinis]|uniref:ABC transporter permease n=1 Tax=Bacillus solitudinis TaxID=2014074 RepID=UPI000C2424BB|nr:ABC transporter permease [Bacillus solitudinis]